MKGKNIMPLGLFLMILLMVAIQPFIPEAKESPEPVDQDADEALEWTKNYLAATKPFEI
jgi:hypothetical protein